ncbi:phosphatase 2C domain-containing protein [Pseudomassariella vexata]|uniref:Phosphatase 2C domain-containing protein n=1 Tax=Pseudomassariella vexata TaxID=1141098 RepID=A0A1Y2DYM2_9PEZI|nr:phosphatase 2C domain-containing protein [Pseudomassariella vexata]ORY64206.1 phosphatase 2C domain-containing protein [Pseudomassariella vexata]
MPLRPRPSRQWSLKDTYGEFARGNQVATGRQNVRLINASLGFIATYIEGQTRTHAQKASGVPVSEPARRTEKQNAASISQSHGVRRGFHNYFVTHLPSSSMHPDSRSSPGLHHKLPRSAAAPHVPGLGSSHPAAPPHIPPNRDLTVVRIPLRSAKHHFGVAESRGQRPYHEDTNQAGTLDMPAFAKRTPISLVRTAMKKSGEGTPADSAFGDPQIFYFAVFDGHGGTQCSDFLREELHGYIEEAAAEFELGSSLRSHSRAKQLALNQQQQQVPTPIMGDAEAGGDVQLEKITIKPAADVEGKAQIPEQDRHGAIAEVEKASAMESSTPQSAEANEPKALRLQKEIVKEYKDTVGGYFRRFNPPHFNLRQEPDSPEFVVSVESVLTYAFLRADLDFVSAQARKPDPDDPYVSDSALNNDEVLGKPHHMPPSGQGIQGRTRFKGGSTASVALISTPTPAPFWHPAASSTLLVGHVGDTRILLCETATGLAKPLTSDHHPSSPSEAQRLRRYTASFVTDSFGEERIQGLANSRAFGDVGSKRLGVSAEPEITRTELGPAQYSFIVLMSDGVSGTLSDQEIVDVVKEAKTPEQGALDVISYAMEVTSDGDNTTCLVVRLGGWERRSEGGLGSLGTKEIRDFRRNEAQDPRRGRR